MRTLIVMDEPGTVDPASDTTLALIEELRRRGHRADVCTVDDLALDGAALMLRSATVLGTRRDRRPAIVTAAAEARTGASYDAVLIRKDPPFDEHYLLATLLLERLRGHALLVNDPAGLRRANEKLFALEFAQFAPATRVTRSIADLRAFLDELGGQMIVKPLDGCGGAGVFHVRASDPNTGAILEAVTRDGSRLVMAQAYLPAAREGDKRILLLDGRPLGAVLRVPARGEARANFHAGGRPVRTTLTTRERQICAAVGERCRAEGLLLVGIDVIGGCLTEVNVTSPAGLREIEQIEGRNLAPAVVAWLEDAVAGTRQELAVAA